MIKNIAGRVRATANVAALHGESLQIGNKTIIQAAKVSHGFGAESGECKRASPRLIGFIVEMKMIQSSSTFTNGEARS